MSQRGLSARIQDHFQSLPDPRRLRVMYPLINIVMIALCAVICGADDFVAIAEFGEQKKDWFEKFLDLSAGIRRTIDSMPSWRPSSRLSSRSVC